MEKFPDGISSRWVLAVYGYSEGDEEVRGTVAEREGPMENMEELGKSLKKGWRKNGRYLGGILQIL